MDHGGPVAEKPSAVKSLDVLPHPHIGLYTVSYLFNGKITHLDSLGVEQVIQPGEVNWRTVGRQAKIKINTASIYRNGTG